MSILGTLSVGAQALRAQQLAIQTTGHNLANAATPGYSRQRVELVSAFPAFIGGVFVGQGVDVAALSRVIDHFAESELLSLQGDIGSSEAESQALASIQEAFPLSGGVNGALSEFFGALSDLSNNPAGLSERVNVLGKARGLAETFAQTRQVLMSLQGNLDQDLRSASQRFNIITERIAGLNREIAASELRGETANDFRDQRQTLLQELISLTGATIREDESGQVIVTVQGLLLVGGTRFARLSNDVINAAGMRQVTYEGPDGISFDASAQFTAGKIGAVLTMRDQTLEGFIDRLDQLAKSIVDEVNTQHALGFDLNGGAGGNFFTPVAAVEGAAANVQIATALAADPRLLAAAASASALPGDNRNALALVNLRSRTVAALGGLTFEDSMLSLIGDIGSQVQTAQSRADFQRSILTQTLARREATSGVNIDEEMTKLIQFQRGFESASLLIRTVDEMYQSLIDMMR